MKALIVHSRRTGLGIIRSLGKKKFDILVADTYKSAGFYSKYVSKGYVICNSITEGENKLLTKLLAIGKEQANGEGIFLFTASDDYLLFFAKYWNELSVYYIATFETDLIKLQNNLEKVKMYLISGKANVPYPNSYYSPVNVSSINEFPVVIKPTLKKTSEIDVVKEAFRIKFCDNQTELKIAINQLDKININYVVQKYIPGADDQLYTAGIFAYKGKLIAAGAARKLRQFPPNTGECSYGELVNEPKIIEYAKRYVEASQITGMCQIEFKKNNNEFYLMEINPRPWSWNQIMDLAGINLPYIACTTVLTKNNEIFYSQKKYKGTWVHSLIDLRYNVVRNKNISYFEWIKNSLNANIHSHWSLKDPLPAFRNLYEFIKYR